MLHQAIVLRVTSELHIIKAKHSSRFASLITSSKKAFPCLCLSTASASIEPELRSF